MPSDTTQSTKVRLAVVVDMVVAADGTVSASTLYRALVLNHAKLTYDAVSAWLDGSAPAPPQIARVPGLEDQVRLHDSVAKQLRQWRQSRGALNVNSSSGIGAVSRHVNETGRSPRCST